MTPIKSLMLACDLACVAAVLADDIYLNGNPPDHLTHSNFASQCRTAFTVLIRQATEPHTNHLPSPN